MRKLLFCFLAILGIFILVACDFMDNETIEFHPQSYNRFTYQGNEYTIMNQTVGENDLDGLKESFFKTLVVDIESQKVVRKSSPHTVTLAYSGLYHLSDGLVIAINHSYYKVSLSLDVKDSDEILNINGFKNDSVDGQFVIDDSDCRIVKLNDMKFRISSEIVADDELKEYQGVIAASKVFISETGKELSQSERYKVDYFGRNVDEEREVWVYGEVYSLDQADAIAVEINDEYRRAYVINPETRKQSKTMPR